MSGYSDGRPLRRAEREITDPAQIDAVFAEATVLFLALRDEPAPYVVPVCFGYEPGVLYFHSAPSGTKIDLLRAHPQVGFSAATGMVLVPGDSACDCAFRARSVAGTGTARIVDEEAGRVHGLNAIMRHYTGSESAPGAPAGPVSAPAYTSGTLARTCVIALRIETVRARRTG